MLRKKPSLHVDLICEPTPKLYPKLKKGELDCLIASRDFVRDPSLFKRYTVDSIHYFAMVSSHHPLCKKESVVMRELADERLLTIGHEGAPIMSDSVRRILREKDISSLYSIILIPLNHWSRRFRRKWASGLFLQTRMLAQTVSRFLSAISK